MKEIQLSQGTIRYREQGAGEPILLVHGLLTNGELWREVAPRLAADFRVIAPDWPLGSHEIPLNEGADRSPLGLAALSNIAPLRWVIAAYVDFVRGTPLLIQVFLVFFALPVIGGRAG